MPRENGSFDGFADKVRKQQGKSSTNNTNNQEMSADDKSVSNDDVVSIDADQRNGFYHKINNRRSLSYNKTPGSPSWRHGNFDSSD